jgi:hypothetical protein
MSITRMAPSLTAGTLTAYIVCGKDPSQGAKPDGYQFWQVPRRAQFNDVLSNNTQQAQTLHSMTHQPQRGQAPYICSVLRSATWLSLVGSIKVVFSCKMTSEGALDSNLQSMTVRTVHDWQRLIKPYELSCMYIMCIFYIHTDYSTQICACCMSRQQLQEQLKICQAKVAAMAVAAAAAAAAAISAIKLSLQGGQPLFPGHGTRMLLYVSQWNASGFMYCIMCGEDQFRQDSAPCCLLYVLMIGGSGARGKMSNTTSHPCCR